MNINTSGTLYIVATPIGNLQDMSLRAVETLKKVDVIAVEDTRHSAPLLQHFAVTTPTLALHDHNERDRAALLLKRLQKGESIALISDAGTPLISDPGYHLVSEAKNAGITVVPIPGACAAIAALSAAGLPTDRFVFEGFLPVKTAARTARLKELDSEARTLIFYEAPHRIMDVLQDMQAVFGDARRVVVARELTKMFETIRSGTLAEIVAWANADKNQQRGEIVILVEGAEKTAATDPDVQRVLTILLEALPLKQAVELAAKITNQRKNELYQQALKQKIE